MNQGNQGNQGGFKQQNAFLHSMNFNEGNNQNMKYFEQHNQSMLHQSGFMNQSGGIHPSGMNQGVTNQSSLHSSFVNQSSFSQQPQIPQLYQNLQQSHQQSQQEQSQNEIRFNLQNTFEEIGGRIGNIGNTFGNQAHPFPSNDTVQPGNHTFNSNTGNSTQNVQDRMSGINNTSAVQNIQNNANPHHMVSNSNANAMTNIDPTLEDITSPSVQILTKTFEDSLFQYKKQLSFSNFLKHFPDDFALENFDVLQKLYQAWLINLEENLRKEFKAIIEGYNLNQQLFEKDKLSLIPQIVINTSGKEVDELARQQSITAMNAHQQSEILSSYQDMNRNIERQIESKKEKIQQFIMQLNSSIEKLQQLIDPVTTRK